MIVTHRRSRASNHLRYNKHSMSREKVKRKRLNRKKVNENVELDMSKLSYLSQFVWNKVHLFKKRRSRQLKVKIAFKQNLSSGNKAENF